MVARFIRQWPHRLPPKLQLAAKAIFGSSAHDKVVYSVNRSQSSPGDIQQRFVESFFENKSEYDTYRQEWENSRPIEIYGEYEDITGAIESVHDCYTEPYDQHDRKYWTGVKLIEGRTLYTLVRKLEPSILVETGVANGWSTMCLLSALAENEHGSLYSVDYQMKSDLDFEAYTRDHFFGNAEIPNDRETGWLIPDDFHERWELRLGRSQRVLPKLLSELETIDFFHHDSEHSDPCMMFEYELAWEHLNEHSGILVSDDMNPSLAWEVFKNTREPREEDILGFPNLGYMAK